MVMISVYILQEMPSSCLVGKLNSIHHHYHHRSGFGYEPGATGIIDLVFSSKSTSKPFGLVWSSVVMMEFVCLYRRIMAFIVDRLSNDAYVSID